MRPAIGSFAAFVLLDLMYPPPANACINDYDGWTWLSAWETQDDTVLAEWCASPDPQATASHYYHSLNLGETDDYWFNLAGGVPLCADPNRHVARLYDAASIMDAITWHSGNTSTGSAPTAYAWLATLVAQHSDDGYIADCNCCDIVATNQGGGDPTQLHYPFFWRYTVVERASTLIHEAVHDWSPHLADSACPGGGSCDTFYGDSNAQTWQIRFLNHALATYRRNPETGEAVVVNFGDGVCGYLPYLAPSARFHAANMAREKLQVRFQTPTSPLPDWISTWETDEPLWEYGGYRFWMDFLVGARWECGKICEPSDYLTGPEACHEAWMPGNAEVNYANATSCAEANDVVAQGVTPDQWSALQHEFALHKQDCIPGVSADFLAGYCNGLSQASSDVTALEDSWTLPDQPGYFDSGQALEQCTRTYCDTVFQTSWIQPARDACYEWSDPSATYGCLDAVCGSLSLLSAEFGETSAEYFAAVQCRRHFIENGGDTSEYFVRSADPCAGTYRRCVDDHHRADWVAARANGACSLTAVSPTTGQAAPATVALYQAAALSHLPALDFASWTATFPGAWVTSCMAEYETCTAIRALAHEIATELMTVVESPPGPGIPAPIEWDRRRAINPFEKGMQGLVQIALTGDSGAFTSRSAVERLASQPEMMFAFASQMGLQNYFAVMGTRYGESVFGAQALADQATAELTIDANGSPVVQAALANVESVRATRVRTESFLTASDFASGEHALTQEQFFDFARSLGNAQSAAAIEATLDALAAAVR